MKRSLLYLTLFVFSSSLIAMEQNQGESKKPAEISSLVDLCTKSMGSIDLNGDEQERYLNAHRATMEKLLRSGSLGDIDITIKVIESMPQCIIDEFDVKLRAFFETQNDDVKCAIIKRLSDENVNKHFDEIIADVSLSSRVKYVLVERAARESSFNTNVGCVDPKKLIKHIEKVAEQGPLTYKIVEIFFGLLKVPLENFPWIKHLPILTLVQILKGEFVSKQARNHGNADLMADYLQEDFKKYVELMKFPRKLNLEGQNSDRLAQIIWAYFNVISIQI